MYFCTIKFYHTLLNRYYLRVIFNINFIIQFHLIDTIKNLKIITRKNYNIDSAVLMTVSEFFHSCLPPKYKILYVCRARLSGFLDGDACSTNFSVVRFLQQHRYLNV